jgi:spore maturation protein CgeB
MRIGFYMQWAKGSLGRAGNVIGDELYAEAMCRTLRGMPGVEHAELYAPGHRPDRDLDMMVYLNDTPVERGWARRHAYYVQNAYAGGSEHALRRFQAAGADGFAFISRKLLEIHRATGGDGIFLPFGVETSVFRPCPPSREYDFDVAYVGGDIKGEARTSRYLLPAARFRLGLYGNWALPRYNLWLRWFKTPAYRRRLAGIARGKLPQEAVPTLYSSARVNLNVTAQDCVDWDVITLRTFEVLACKGFLVTDRVAAAAEALQGGVVFTEGGDDLVEKVAYYLARPEERRAVAEAGFRYTIAHATIERRMLELLRYLKAIA